MWCSICRQDVPGSIVPGGGQYCCPRCGEMLPSSTGRPVEHPPEKVVTEGQTSIPGAPPAHDYDEWEMDERLRHLDRIYARSPARSPLTLSDSRHFRVDLHHASVPREQLLAERPAVRRPGWAARLGLIGIGLGLAITVCGGSLMALAHYGARPDLMPMGIPIAVAGQIFLLLGLVLQLDSSGAAPHGTSNTAGSRPPLPMGNTTLRFDDGPDTPPQLADLAARLEELSRKLEERDERWRQ